LAPTGLSASGGQNGARELPGRPGIAGEPPGDLCIPDIGADSRHLATAWARGHGLASFLARPVLLDGILLGVLALWDSYPIGLDPEGHDILDAFCA
jgi:hypothetical protein